MFYVAKFIQAVGVLDVGYAVCVGLSSENGLARELRLATVGLVVFCAGRLIERRVR